jgi:indole-3-glycerol phosphate synthase
MILDEIAEYSRMRIAVEKTHLPEKAVAKQALSMRDAEGSPKFPFEQALRAPGLSFICEVKKASPSKGLIAPDFPYVRIAQEYEAAGASAISVLTEPKYFMGRAEYLREISKAVTIPILRKDFVIDSYQIYEAKCIGASAILLICALLDAKTLKEYAKLADDLGLSVLTEARDEAEVRTAVESGARIVGVNNRDLRTFIVDLETGGRLLKHVPKGVVAVAESGIGTADDVRKMIQNGADAILVGESLMRAEDKAAYLEGLRKIANQTEVCNEVSQ